MPDAAKGEVAPLLRLISGARRIADPSDPLGAEARARLPRVTGLTPEGVQYAIRRCLETNPSEDEVLGMVAQAPRASRAWVSLSANVFTAAHRAIALALATGGEVFVKSSRREPVMTELLARAAEGLFHVVETIEPAAHDLVFAYGTDETLARIEAQLPMGVRYLGHGSGMGLVWITPPLTVDIGALADRVARDVIPFDQRGCLSPRVVVVERDDDLARCFAQALSEALARLEMTVPAGDVVDVAHSARYRELMAYQGAWLPAGRGGVGLDLEGAALVVPPAARMVHVVRTDDVASILKGVVPSVTCVAANQATDPDRVARLLPRARRVAPGSMQRPPFDGPVDRRSVLRVVGEA